MTKKTLDHFLAQVVEKPQVFFSSNQKIADSALEMAKYFYDDGRMRSLGVDRKKAIQLTVLSISQKSGTSSILTIHRVIDRRLW